MMHFSRTKFSWQPFRLLLFICVSCMFLTAADAENSRARFVKLDSEIQAIKEEILDINRDILLLEETSLYPHGQQLIVLVTVATGSSLKPDTISLQLDGQLVGQHQYTDSEHAALHEGGVHRLYTGRLENGIYQLLFSVTGERAKGDAFRRQRSVIISKQTGRKYMELHLGLRDDTTQPGLTIRQW